MANPPSSPYATPMAASDAASSGDARGTYGKFRKNGTLKLTLIALLVLDALIYILNNGVLTYLDMQQHENAPYLHSNALSPLDNIIMMAGGFHLFIGIILIIVFCVWLNRSCKNAWFLDPPRMKTTPGWAVGYYFIPILMLWKPYESMKEIRSASYGKEHALTSIMPLWWSLWLASLLINWIASKLYLSDDIDHYLTACKLDLVSTPLNILLNSVCIALVTGITLAQERRLHTWHQ